MRHSAELRETLIGARRHAPARSRVGQSRATRTAIPTISRCSTRSAACSQPSCNWPRHGGIINAHWSISTARLAATGSFHARFRTPRRNCRDGPMNDYRAKRPAPQGRRDRDRRREGRACARSPMRKIILIALGAAASPLRLSRTVRPLHAVHFASPRRGFPDPGRAGGRR